MLLMLATAASVVATGLFAVQAVDGNPSSSDKYLACLETHQERLRSMRKTGSLLSNRVYRKVGELNRQPGLRWTVLSVSEVKLAKNARRILAISKKCAASSGVVIERTELMRATPSSYHLAPVGRPLISDVQFVVEFIAVQPRPSSLSEYRETMATSIGPAVGRLVSEGQFYSMIGLETDRVLWRRDSLFSPNQLHIRGFYKDVGITPPAMTRYMQEINPRAGDFRAVFGRLDAIRAKPRDDVAEEISSLSL